MLEDYGVAVRDGAEVERVEKGAVRLEGGEEIAFDALLIATGLSAAPVMARLGLEQLPSGACA